MTEHKLSATQLKDLRGVSQIEVNTMKPEKVFWSWVLLQSLVRGVHAKDLMDGALVRCRSSELAADYQEPKFTKAHQSSDHKATWLSGQSREVVVSGADSVVHIFDVRRRQWQTLHKLGRESGKVPRAELIASEYRRLRDLLVFPQSRRVYLAWDLSATYINGGKHTFSEMLLVDTAPIEQRLFWQVFGKAVETDTIRSLSPRMPLVETVLENDPKAKLGFFTPGELEDLGGEAWKRLHTADKWLQRQAISAVATTVPHGIFTTEGMGEIFAKAQAFASRSGV